MLNFLSLFILFPLLSSMVFQDRLPLEPAPEARIGLWVGKETQEDNTEVVWFDSCYPNGLLIIRFLNYENGELVSESIERCSIHFEGDVETIITHQILFIEPDGERHLEDSYYVERYKVLFHDDESIVYQHLRNDHIYKMRKLSVDPTFKRSDHLTEDGTPR